MDRRKFLGSSIALASVAGLTPARRALAASSADVPALSRTGGSIVLKGNDIDDLRARLNGTVLTRASVGYDAARRVWNGAFDRHPALIASWARAEDVVNAVQFAAANDLLVAVRAGGHSLPGYSACEGGFVIDLVSMRGVSVDPATRIAKVSPGVLLGELDRETQAYGLVVPAGTVSHTGVAGLTLGGGVGRLLRKFGLTSDSLLAVDIVTANGKLLRASADENQDLLWALRGGGGNFGVVTSFEFRAHEFGHSSVAGDIVFPIEQARAVLDAFADYSPQASDEFWMDPTLECDDTGRRQVTFLVSHCGDERQASKEIDIVRKFGKAVLDNVARKPWVVAQSEHDSLSPHGRGYYMSGGAVHHLDPKLIEHAIASIKLPGAELAKISLTQHGGANARMAVDSSAYATRKATHNFVVRASWDDPGQAEARTAWHRQTWKGFEPFSQGIYANLNAGDPNARARSAYGENLDRLIDIKTRYDPKNLFHLNPNIKPRSG